MPHLSIETSESILNQVRVLAALQRTTIQSLVLNGLIKIGIAVSDAEFGSRSRHKKLAKAASDATEDQRRITRATLFASQKLGQNALLWLTTFNDNLNDIPFIILIKNADGEKIVLKEIKKTDPFKFYR